MPGYLKSNDNIQKEITFVYAKRHLPYLFGYKLILAISRDPKLLTQYSVISREPFSVLKFIVDHEIFVKIQSDSDCKIVLRAIKWMKNIRNKQATWSWGFVHHCRKVRYYHHQAPKKHSMYCFVECEKMVGTLTELNLETLAAVFQGEIIVAWPL